MALREISAGDGVMSTVTTAVVAGTLGGVVVGGADAVAGWQLAAQYVPEVSQRAQFVVLVAVLYGLSGGALAFVLRAVRAAVLATRLGDLLRFAAAHRAAVRERDSRQALAGLALVVAGLPTVGSAVWFAFALSESLLVQRRHVGLVIASAMVAVVVALVVGVLLSFIIARPLEALLIRVARRDPIARRLSSRVAQVGVALVLVLVVGAAAGTAAWPVISLLPLRIIGVGAALLTLSLGAALLPPSLTGRLRARVRTVLLVSLPSVCLVLVLWVGESAAVLRATETQTGLGATLVGVLRGLSDWDRDGYARLLGGGDCDDTDPGVYPGAFDFAGDGIDQSCSGRDREPPARVDPEFVAPPPHLNQGTNVLLVTIDTVRADRFGAYGYSRATTPALDALGKEGTVFLNAWAHAPSTRFSVPAILTGRHPLEVLYDKSVWWPGIDKEAVTIAEVMKGRGRATGAVLNYSYFSPTRGMNQGFDHYDNANARLHVGRDPAQTSGSSSLQQTDAALKFLDRYGEKPFFLWVHYYDPHFSYERHPGTTEFGETKSDLYDHEIRFTDDQIGRLFDALRERGVYDRTIIVVTGDHGEGFGEHGVDLHGYHLYSAQTKVPLMMRVPGLPAQRATMPVAHVDILPTLANLVGARPTPGLQGRSLVDVLSGEDPNRDRWLLQQLDFGKTRMRGVVNQRCHGVYQFRPHTSWELYRVDTDPNETHDISSNPGECAEARAELDRLMDRNEVDTSDENIFPSNPAKGSSLGLILGERVELIQIELSEEKVKPGATFDVTLTFRAIAPIDEGYSVFLHFEGGRGHRFIGDHKPSPGFARWPRGAYVRYSTRVRVPGRTAEGRYALQFGLFQDDDRMPVTDPGTLTVSADRAELGAIVVEKKPRAEKKR